MGLLYGGSSRRGFSPKTTVLCAYTAVHSLFGFPLIFRAEGEKKKRARGHGKEGEEVRTAAAGRPAAPTQCKIQGFVVGFSNGDYRESS